MQRFRRCMRLLRNARWQIRVYARHRIAYTRASLARPLAVTTAATALWPRLRNDGSRDAAAARGAPGYDAELNAYTHIHTSRTQTHRSITRRARAAPPIDSNAHLPYILADYIMELGVTALCLGRFLFFSRAVRFLSSFIRIFIDFIDPLIEIYMLLHTVHDENSLACVWYQLIRFFRVNNYAEISASYQD